jgi:tRNA-2-methylthio-N6-dimethylallyladenosine synthase
MKTLNTFYIRTYGCQMNELDTEVMKGQLIKRGLTPVPSEDGADIIIFNTCSIRDLAERKVMGKLGQLSRGKKKYAIIGVAGCMAMAKKEKLFKKFPHLDFIIGTNNLHELNDIIDNILVNDKQISRTDEKLVEDKFDYISAKRSSKVKAYVSIIRGCNNFCSYCVVPYTRGREVSRPSANIIEECSNLVQKGYKEITLLGQNVNSYGKDFDDKSYLFHDLLYHLDKIQGLERIRFMTSHPVDITTNLMLAIKDLPSVCEFVHFPVQAGSSRVLKKMNRKYTKEQYLEKVEQMRQIVPNVTIGTDIIVGFPTETHDEFLQTYDLLNEIKYDVAFIFAYSKRKGTPSYRFDDDVTEEEKQKRLQILLKLHNEISENLHKKMIGSIQEVLVEETSNDNSCVKGRTRGWHKVFFKGTKDMVNTLQQVKIKSMRNQTFIGEII